jgi:hypothetical protein
MAQRLAKSSQTPTSINELIRSLKTITQHTAREHRRWLQIHMYTWWTDNGYGEDPILPPGVHQRNLQRRGDRRRAGEVKDRTGQETSTETAVDNTHTDPIMGPDPTVGTEDTATLAATPEKRPSTSQQLLTASLSQQSNNAETSDIEMNMQRT